MANDFTIAVLISGRGSNLESLIRNQNHYKIAAVLSDNPTAGGLAKAAAAAIPVATFPRANFPTLRAQKSAIYEAVEALQPNLIALAGFMQIVEAEFVERHFGSIINIHPSLLPALPGLHTHERAISEKHKQHGCSVHYVDCGVDTGPIIAQAACQIEQTDSADTLAARVLEFEHRLYPWVVNNIARGNIALEGKTVRYAATTITSAREERFILSSPVGRSS